MHFENTEISFDVPDDWADQSMTTFIFREAATSLTLTRAKPTGDSLAAQTEAVLAQLERIFPRLEVLAQSEMTSGTTRAVRLDIEWQMEHVAVRNVIAITVHEGELWSLTATTPKDRFEETARAITKAITSFSTKPG